MTCKRLVLLAALFASSNPCIHAQTHLPAQSPETPPPGSISVVAQHADPRGVLDSSSAFQSAIDTHRPIWVPPGKYRIHTALVLASNTVLASNPGTATLFVDPGNQSKSGALLLTASAVHNVIVRGLILDGNSGAIPRLPNTRLVYIDGGVNVAFLDDIWQNSEGSALVFSAVHSPVSQSGVSRSTFRNLGFAWRPPGNGTLQETAPVIVFSNGSLKTNLGNHVSDNDIAHVGSDAISIQQQTHFVAERNKLTLNEEGWKPLTAKTAITYGVGGIYVFNNDADIVISHNQISGATGNCFDLIAITKLAVSQNTATDCGGAGISIGSAINHFTITGNNLARENRSAKYPFPNVTHQGMLSFGCGREPCKPTDAIVDGTVAGNQFDNREPQTAPIDIWQERTIILRNLQSTIPITREP